MYVYTPIRHQAGAITNKKYETNLILKEKGKQEKMKLNNMIIYKCSNLQECKTKSWLIPEYIVVHFQHISQMLERWVIEQQSL